MNWGQPIATRGIAVCGELHMPRDLACVHRAADLAEADIVAAWLAEQGIVVHVKDRLVIEMLHTPLAYAPRGVEVCVVDRGQVDRAKELLLVHAGESAVKKLHDAAGPDIEAVCEECGTVSRFPFAQRGSVQTCPHCRQYLDVPQA